MTAVADPLTSRAPARPLSGAWRHTEAALTLLVSTFGLWMRLFHARTFHSPGRASDYESTVEAIQWVVTHHRTFDVGDPLNNGYHGPLWYVLAALIIGHGHPVRAAAYISVAAYAVRQAVLWVAMRRAAPGCPLARFAALALHAVLPVSVYQDGIVYNEALHATSSPWRCTSSGASSGRGR
jgi:hypothetical protein